MTKRRSVAELREALLRVNDLVDGIGAPLPAETGRLELLRRATRAVGQAPIYPPELGTAAFLESIHERAARASSRAIGARCLRELATPLTAPADVVWVEPTDSPKVARILAVGHVGRVPGWLRPPRRAVVSYRRRAVIAAAAAILLAALTLRTFHGTPDKPNFVFVDVDRPLSLDHPSDWLRALADGTR